jgi:hypothetical protein
LFYIDLGCLAIIYLVDLNDRCRVWWCGIIATFIASWRGRWRTWWWDGRAGLRVGNLARLSYLTLTYQRNWLGILVVEHLIGWSCRYGSINGSHINRNWQFHSTILAICRIIDIFLGASWANLHVITKMSFKLFLRYDLCLRFGPCA